MPSNSIFSSISFVFVACVFISSYSLAVSDPGFFSMLSLIAILP